MSLRTNRDHQCVIMGVKTTGQLKKNVTFDSTNWSWLLYNQLTHTCTHTHTLLLEGRDSLSLSVYRYLCMCVCVWECVVTTHLFHIRSGLHHNTLWESAFTTLSSVSIFIAFQSVPRDLDGTMVVIHQRKFWPVCGTNEFLHGGGGGGWFQLHYHTLHSLVRHLICYKVNTLLPFLVEIQSWSSNWWIHTDTYRKKFDTIFFYRLLSNVWDDGGDHMIFLILGFHL